jgi:hypothetical protein
MKDTISQLKTAIKKHHQHTIKIGRSMMTGHYKNYVKKVSFAPSETETTTTVYHQIKTPHPIDRKAATRFESSPYELAAIESGMLWDLKVSLFPSSPKEKHEDPNATVLDPMGELIMTIGSLLL